MVWRVYMGSIFLFMWVYRSTCNKFCLLCLWIQKDLHGSSCTLSSLYLIWFARCCDLSISPWHSWIHLSSLQKEIAVNFNLETLACSALGPFSPVLFALRIAMAVVEADPAQTWRSVRLVLNQHLGFVESTGIMGNLWNQSIVCHRRSKNKQPHFPCLRTSRGILFNSWTNHTEALGRFLGPEKRSKLVSVYRFGWVLIVLIQHLKCGFMTAWFKFYVFRHVIFWFLDFPCG